MIRVFLVDDHPVLRDGLRHLLATEPGVEVVGEATDGQQQLDHLAHVPAAFTTLLDRTQAIASLNRPGNPYDNALAESAWSTLKTELLPRRACFADLEEARLELAEYLDYYYNSQRLHSALGYCTPLEIELHYLFNLP